MSVPTHEAGCETRLWQTSCPDCGDVVYFFSCSCGSKVFFDLNQPPWNPHGDRCIPYLISQLRHVEHYSPEVIWEMIRERANASGQPVPSGTYQQVFQYSTTGQNTVRPHEVTPTGEEGVRVEGRILCINQVNFFRRFNLVDNVFARAILQELVRVPYVEVRLREDPDSETGLSNEFVFYLPQSQFHAAGLEVNSRATAILSTRVIATGRRIWVCESIQQPW